MGKRYYCDYCDKSFADNPTSRKTHLTGVTHARAKKAHYDAFKDEETQLSEDHGKRPCKMFLSSGDCRFGERCQYSHMTNEDRARVSESIRNKHQRKARLGEEIEKMDVKSSMADWTKKREERLREEKPEEEKPSVFIPEYELAESLKGFTNLPLSVLPPTREAILNSDFTEWG